MSNILNVKELANGKTRATLSDGRTVSVNGFAETPQEFVALCRNATEPVKVGGRKFSGGANGAITKGKASAEGNGKVIADMIEGTAAPVVPNVNNRADALADALATA